MQIATIGEAESDLSNLIDQALMCEEVFIARWENQVARLVAIQPAPKTRPIGLYKDEAFKLGPEFSSRCRTMSPLGIFKGEFEIGPAFSEPLPDEELEAWGQ